VCTRRHLPFAIEITDQIKWGEENIVAISVENVLKPSRVPSGDMPGGEMSLFASTPKTTYDFYPFAGIHRPWCCTPSRRRISRM